MNGSHATPKASLAAMTGQCAGGASAIAGFHPIDSKIQARASLISETKGVGFILRLKSGSGIALIGIA